MSNSNFGFSTQIMLFADKNKRKLAHALMPIYDFIDKVQEEKDALKNFEDFKKEKNLTGRPAKPDRPDYLDDKKARKAFIALKKWKDEDNSEPAKRPKDVDNYEESFTEKESDYRKYLETLGTYNTYVFREGQVDKKGKLKTRAKNRLPLAPFYLESATVATELFNELKFEDDVINYIDPRIKGEDKKKYKAIIEGYEDELRTNADILMPPAYSKENYPALETIIEEDETVEEYQAKLKYYILKEKLYTKQDAIKAKIEGNPNLEKLLSGNKLWEGLKTKAEITVTDENGYNPFAAANPKMLDISSANVSKDESYPAIYDLSYGRDVGPFISTIFNLYETAKGIDALQEGIPGLNADFVKNAVNKIGTLVWYCKQDEVFKLENGELTGVSKIEEVDQVQKIQRDGEDIIRVKTSEEQDQAIDALQTALDDLTNNVSLNTVVIEKKIGSSKIYMRDPVEIKGEDFKRGLNIEKDSPLNSMLDIDVTIEQLEYDMDNKGFAVQVQTRPQEGFILNQKPDLFYLNYVKLEYVKEP